MRPQRHLPRGPVLAGLLSLFAAAPAASQQVYFDSLWVAAYGNNCTSGVGPRGSQFWCDGPSASSGPTTGNISNNPRIEFDQDVSPLCATNASFPSGSTTTNVCNTKMFLCARVGYSNTQGGPTTPGFAIDKVSFEIFKFGSGSNPLDPQSTPPLQTLFIDAPGDVPGNSVGTLPTQSQCTSVSRFDCGYCVLWDGSINILGEVGKSNGAFGFRATVETNQTGPSGNINIIQVRAYPGGATEDADGKFVLQQPITVDVTNVHVVRTTPTVVGAVTGVPAEPYNITYRLSKDATMYLTITNTSDANLGNPLVRRLVDGLPRVGEGTPDGVLHNGDAWNGRHDNGDLMPPGVYLATLQPLSRDQFGFDLGGAATRQISLDPLQITDILVQPLTSQSTSLAVLAYTLTEPAAVFLDVYPPGTQFCAGLNNVNAPTFDSGNPASPKNFGARLGDCSGPAINPVRSITEQKIFRAPVVSFWDGRDQGGAIVPDGDYVFVLYGALPSQNGFAYSGAPNDKRIWTSVAKTGFWTVARGMVTVSQIGPSTTVIGSSPSVAGLNPFVFTYTLSRDAHVSVGIFDAGGLQIKRRLVIREPRPGNFTNREFWTDGAGDDGRMLSSGTYLVELTAADPFFPAKVTTTTALFLVDLFRITDVAATPLLTGATDVVTLTYQLSQTMNVAWNIYPPGTTITGSTATWPPCNALTPGVCAQTVHNGSAARPITTVSGMRPGRLKITEFWDGRDANGLFVPDGSYIFTLAAQSTTTPQYFASDRIFGALTVARGSIVFPMFAVKPTIPALFNSSQTITLPPFELDYSLTRQSSVTVRILDTAMPPKVVRTVVLGQVRDAGIIHQDFWDARDDRGNFVQSGFYTAQVIAGDLASALSSGSTVQQTIAVDPLRIYDVAVAPLLKDNASALISYQVSETMKVAVKIYKPGTSFDAAGNPMPPESSSLVRRIVGVRPARSEINEIWDGKDEKLAFVQDGSYLFKVVGSTDINAIDTITGNVKAGASLAEDLVVAEVPVIRGESADPMAEFLSNTFMYPNPVGGASATFNIYVPFQSDVSVKIFSIAGELVYERAFQNQPRSTDNGPIVFTWDRVNSAGRRLAPGVYFVLVREEDTVGGTNVLQTVKKMLLQ